MTEATADSPWQETQSSWLIPDSNQSACGVSADGELDVNPCLCC